MEKEQSNPPLIEEADNGLSDADLLSAISRNPEAAHALAAIASGADIASTLASLLPQEPEEVVDEAVDDSEASRAAAESIPVASTRFLGSSRTDFWDESFI